MSNMTMTFDAVSESTPGPKWRKRWNRSWPAYEAWFLSRGGDRGPDRRACRAALRAHMPEIVPIYDRLVTLAGGGDRAARFLSTWCPPTYLGGCSLAAMSDQSGVRLLRNYDLSPDLNEGLLLHSAWNGKPVMGMVEFLWGLSDGINEAGLSVALAYGGRSESASGFGITTILRYVLETCDTVKAAIAVLERVPSHMAYNIVLADASGATACVELYPGGGARRMPCAIATNHQSGPAAPDRASFTRTYERHRHLGALKGRAVDLRAQFTSMPLRQDRYSEGFGTLFTAEYDPVTRRMALIWPDETWNQSLGAFREGRRDITFVEAGAHAGRSKPAPTIDRRRAAKNESTRAANIDWSRATHVDWARVGRDYAAGAGRPVEAYLAELS